MAKQTSAAVKPNLLNRAMAFKTEVWAEMKKASWPSFEETKASTSIVLILLAIMAAVVGVFDLVFNKGVLAILGKLG